MCRTCDESVCVGWNFNDPLGESGSEDGNGGKVGRFFTREGRFITDHSRCVWKWWSRRLNTLVGLSDTLRDMKHWRHVGVIRWFWVLRVLVCSTVRHISGSCSMYKRIHDATIEVEEPSSSSPSGPLSARKNRRAKVWMKQNRSGR